MVPAARHEAINKTYSAKYNFSARFWFGVNVVFFIVLRFKFDLNTFNYSSKVNDMFDIN